MRRIMKRAAGLALAAALVVTGIYSGGTDVQAAKKPKKITMNAKRVNIPVGGKYKLKVKKVTPKKAGKAVTYKTSNKKIATVSKKGVIKGKKIGKAKITVISKLNKKVKTKVSVFVKKVESPVVTPTPVVSPTAQVTVVPTPSPTPEPSSKPTPTKKPTRPPATPTPEPTAPAEMLDHPSAPYTIEFNKETVELQGEKVVDENGEETITGASYVLNDDGSLTVSVDKIHCGIVFKIPESLKENNFDTVTVTYKDATNVGEGYGCGLWRNGDKNTEDVVAWNSVFASKDEAGNPVTEGDYVATIAGKADGTNAWYVNKILLFHNDTSVHELKPSAAVTITKVVFSHSEYKGETQTPVPSPTPDFAAAKISKPVVVDGVATDEVWSEVTSQAIQYKPQGTTDTTATAKIAWDENNLYGLVEVKDADIDFAATETHERDGIDFFLDEDYSMDKGFAVNKDAFQYRITGLSKNEDGMPNDALTKEIVGGDAAAKADYAGIESAYSFTEDGYIVEFRIPFKAAKKAGDFVGFDIIVQACSQGKRDAEIYFRNTDKALDYHDLSDTFGTLRLEGDEE